MIIDKIKKGVKVLTFVLLIVLAGVGVGLSGGIPLPMVKNRRDSDKEDIEMVEEKKEESTIKKGGFKG